MNNVWGRGGLFEQALASKLGNQDAETALKSSQVGVDAMNANTKLAEVGNNYDLGLRNDAVNRGQLDVNRGQLGVNQMNSMSKRMDSETSRVANAPASLISSPVANNLGLRTYNAVSPEAAAEFGKSYGGVGTDLFKPFGMKNGGLVMKPKMVQPGYMHGGKITPPKGYENGGMVGSQVPEWVAKSRAETRATPEFKQAIGELTKKGWKPNPKDPESDIDAVDKYLFATKTLPETKAERGYKKGGMIGCAKGGKIGDVKKDTGKDTINAKVRPGEYMLNPETVAHIGGGNYEAGVRNLNQIVREATGKEPGPTPMGKSGKAGFGDSASADDLFRREALDKMAQAKRDASAFKNVNGPSSTIYVDSEGNASTTRPSVSSATRAEAIGSRAGQATRTGINAVKGVLPAARNIAGQAIAPVVATLEAGHNLYSKDDFYDDPSVPFVEKGKQGLRDLSKPLATWAGGAVGAGAGMGVGSVATGAAGALLARTAMDQLVDDEGDAYKAWRAAHPKPVEAIPTSEAAAAAPAPAENKPEAAPRDYDKEVADKLSESNAAAEAAKPSLRDMMLTRLRNIDRIAATNGGLGSQYWNNARNEAVNSLTELDKADTVAAYRMANARNAAGNKAVDNFRKQATASFQTEELKDGKPTGKTTFDENAFNMFEASVIAPLAARGEDFYALPDAERMKLLASYQDRRRGTDAVMSELRGVRDAPSSRRLIHPEQFTERELQPWNDFINPNSSIGLGALWNSAVRSDDYDKVLEYRNGNDTFVIPKSKMSRTASGLRNTDVMREYGLE